MSRDRATPKAPFNTPLAGCSSTMSYLSRIGATFTGMRRAAIIEAQGQYPKEVANVVFSDEGEVQASEADYAPSEAELVLIKAEIAGLKMPRPKAAPWRLH